MAEDVRGGDVNDVGVELSELAPGAVREPQRYAVLATPGRRDGGHGDSRSRVPECRLPHRGRKHFHLYRVALQESNEPVQGERHSVPDMIVGTCEDGYANRLFRAGGRQ